MHIILKTAEEIKELLYEGKERACLAIEYKEECPALASTYLDLANAALSQAEKLHAAIIEYISKLKTTEEFNEEMKEVWDFEHKQYIKKYEKVKIRIAMYSKM